MDRGSLSTDPVTTTSGPGYETADVADDAPLDSEAVLRSCKKATSVPGRFLTHRQSPLTDMLDILDPTQALLPMDHGGWGSSTTQFIPASASCRFLEAWDPTMSSSMALALHHEPMIDTYVLDPSMGFFEALNGESNYDSSQTMATAFNNPAHIAWITDASHLKDKISHTTANGASGGSQSSGTEAPEPIAQHARHRPHGHSSQYLKARGKNKDARSKWELRLESVDEGLPSWLSLLLHPRPANPERVVHAMWRAVQEARSAEGPHQSPPAKGGTIHGYGSFALRSGCDIIRCH